MFFYIIVVVAFSFLGRAQSCSCKKENVSVYYCKADFVAQVKFLSIVSNISDPFHVTEYDVDFVKVYKKNNKFDTVKKKNVIVTPPKEACGVMIDMSTKTAKNQDWILFGTNSQDELFINACWPNSPWSKEMNDNLEKGPLSSTDCTVKPVEDKPKPKSDPTETSNVAQPQPDKNNQTEISQPQSESKNQTDTTDKPLPQPEKKTTKTAKTAKAKKPSHTR